MSNWNKTATENDWCTGNGTWDNPYIIENVTLNCEGIYGGIRIIDSTGFFIIRNCTIYNTAYIYGDGAYGGIRLDNVENGVLSNNTLYDCDTGIRVYLSTNITIINNTIFNNYRGIQADWMKIQIINNRVENNSNFGIKCAHNSTIIRNKVLYNTWDGIVCQGDYSNVSDNEVAYHRGDGITIWGDYNIVLNNTISNSEEKGMHVGLTNNVIKNNTLINNLYGLFIWQCDNAEITNNNIINNSFTGIRIASASNYNDIYDNIISNNINYGIFIPNLVQYPNKIYKNAFLNNGIHAYQRYQGNNWDNGTIGNYWDNYTGSDNDDDGIGDVPYTSILGDDDNYDQFPIWWDAPTLHWESPLNFSRFGKKSLEFNFNISKGCGHSYWYQSVDVEINLSSTLLLGIQNEMVQGTIDQAFWDNLNNGLNIIKFYVNDSKGWIDSTDLIIEVEKDAPLIMVNSPNPHDPLGIMAPNFNVLINDSNLDSMWYTLDGGLNNYTFTDNGTINPTSWASLLDGLVTIIFYANDTVGNIASEEVTIIKDTLIPTLIVNTPADNDVFGSLTPSFNIIITDENLDSMWYSLDGGLNNYTFTDNETINPTSWTSLLDGLVTIIFYTNDTAGNNASAEVTIIKDTTHPVITIITPNNGDVFSTDAPTFEISIDEANLESKSYSLDGGITNNSISGLSGSINQDLWDSMLEGEVYLTFYAIDKVSKIGIESVTVIKRGSTQISIPGYNVLLLLGMISVVSMIIITKRSRKLFF